MNTDFKGDIDEDGFEVQYMPCLVQIDDGDDYVETAVCWSKRHKVYVYSGFLVNQNSMVTITLLGIRNPDTRDHMNFQVAVMDVGTQWGDEAWERIDWLVNFQYRMNYPSTALIDFFKISTDNSRTQALRGNDDYKFHFTVWGEEGKYLPWKKNSQLLLAFPNDYVNHPVSDITSPSDSV